MDTETLKKILLFPIHHKSKLLLTLVITLMIFALRFPYRDLADWISVKVAEASQNQLFVEFESMSPIFSPTLGLRLVEPSVQPAGFAPVNMHSLTLTPAWLSFLRFAPGAKISASGLWSSDGLLSWQSQKKTSQGAPAHSIDLNLEGLDIGQVLQILGLPIQLRGRIDLEAETLVEPTFQEQPLANFQLAAPSLDLQPSRVFIPNMGPLDLPHLRWSQVSLKGRLENGELYLDESRLGSREDLVSGRFRGRTGLRMERRNNNLTPQVGGYDFRVELLVKNDAPQLVSLSLLILDSFKTPTPEGNLYLFRATGDRFGPAPRLAPLSRFEQ